MDFLHNCTTLIGSKYNKPHSKPKPHTFQKIFKDLRNKINAILYERITLTNPNNNGILNSSRSENNQYILKLKLKHDCNEHDLKVHSSPLWKRNKNFDNT